MSMMNKEKVRIEVFVPLTSCVCDFAPLLDKVGLVTSKFKDLVQVQIRSLKSPEAFKYGVQDMCIIINEKNRLPPDFNERELEDAILRV
jgi:hypothetical protein